jgi:hypothetical protein
MHFSRDAAMMPGVGVSVQLNAINRYSRPTCHLSLEASIPSTNSDKSPSVPRGDVRFADSDDVVESLIAIRPNEKILSSVSAGKRYEKLH